MLKLSPCANENGQLKTVKASQGNSLYMDMEKQRIFNLKVSLSII